MIKMIDLFAVIGGIRLGFEKVFDKNSETVFASEIDNFARIMYEQNFNDTFEIAGDIMQIDEKKIPKFYICLAGFPCQAFSIAVRKQGFNYDIYHKNFFAAIMRGNFFMI